MEHEVPIQEGVPANKQAFIYKKNPTSGAKAITRKLRPSQAPPAKDGRNDSDRNDLAQSRAGANQSATRSSQHEAETIATNGYNQSRGSPNKDMFSSGKYNQVKSDVNVGSELRGKGLDNRRFVKGQRVNASAANRNLTTKYEDNIDSETEVFIDPKFDQNIRNGGRSTDMGLRPRMKQAARELFLNQSSTDVNRPKPPPLMTKQDTYDQIDQVMNSNLDDRQKQRAVAQIQDQYRQSRINAVVRRQSEQPHRNKPRIQKQYKDQEDGYAGQAPFDQDGNEMPNKLDNKGRPVKQARKKKNRAQQGQPDDGQLHQNYLMPEMNDFLNDDKTNKRNYLTQDEMDGMGNNSKLGGTVVKKKNKNRAESEDDELSKLQNFTPGRIRASRMGQSNKNENPAGQLSNNAYFKTPQGINKQRANSKPAPMHQNMDHDSLDSIDDTDYNQILPAVKVRAKQRKKRSPDIISNGYNSSTIAPNKNNHSTSRISNSGFKAQKLRETLDQNLHWIPTSVKVPIKQTHFYDDSHGANITAQTQQTWKIRNGQVVLDEFDTEKSKVPVNRHRIPRVGNADTIPEKVKKFNPSLKKGKNETLIWDMDGRKHIKPRPEPRPKRQAQNSQSKVDLPKINPPNQPSESINRKHIKKFMDINDPKVQNYSPRDMVDIRMNLYRPPADMGSGNEPPTKDYGDLEQHEPQPDHNNQPEHEENCNEPTPCQFCNKSYLPKDIDRHESKCNKPQFCKTCAMKFPRKELLKHKSECKGHQDPNGGEAYLKHIEKQKKKLEKKTKSKVVLEDDYLKPDDFRDPGGRKSASVKREQSNDSVQDQSQRRQSVDDRSRSVNRRNTESQNQDIQGSLNGSKSPLASAVNRVTTPITNTHGSQPNKSNRSKGILKDTRRDSVENSVPLTPNLDESKKGTDGGDHVSNFQDNTNNYRPHINSNSQDRNDNKSEHIYEQKMENLGREESVERASVKAQEDNSNSQKLVSVDQPNYSQQPIGKHLNSSTDVMGQRRDSKSPTGIDQDLLLNKNKSQTSASVRFAYGTHEDLSRTQPNHQSQDVKMMKKDEATNETYQSMHAKFDISRQDRPNKTQQEQRRKSSKKDKKINKVNTGDYKSQETVTGKGRLSSKIYFPKNASNSPSNKSSSKSPVAKRVMERLTHHRVKIDEETKLLINGSEILSSKGIQGKVNKVGVGFGTGRHTSGLRGDLLKEVPLVLKTEEAPRPASPKRVTIEPVVHRAPIRFDASMQADGPDNHSMGCDPMSASMHSAKNSAHISQRSMQVSCRTQTIIPDKESIGVSAKPLSEMSVREQGDQVTDGRFEPEMIDTQVNTELKLLEDYMKKETNDFGGNTVEVIFGTPKPIMVSILQQTEPEIRTDRCPPEPVYNEQAVEHETCKHNDETGSNSSLLDIPRGDQIMVLPPPSPEPSEDDDPYVDDWALSQIYQYAYSLHYEHLVKKRLISVTITKRPVTPQNEKGMTKQQRFENNLNPQNQKILSYMECDYGQSVLRHKSANYRTHETLTDLYDRAKTTITVLNENMVRPDICDQILFSHYKDITNKNVLKLLLRVRRLYDARNESVNLLKYVMEVEALIEPKSELWRIMQDNSRASLKKYHRQMIERVLKILSYGLTRITIFQQEHKLFRDEFKFNKREYRDYVRDIGRIIGGFLLHKREKNPALQENGLILEEHDEHREQTERYEEWAENSIKEYGKLELPTEEEVQQILSDDIPNKKLKGSRIDAALNKLREEQKNKSELESSNLGMSLTSKSKIIAQMQTKNINRELVVKHQNTDPNGVKKTVISDQLLDRIQESANKRDRIARQNEEKLRREEDGCEESKSENLEPFKVTPYSNHDDPMALSDLEHRPQDENSEEDFKPQDIIKSVSGKYEDYSQINVTKYNFASSTKSNPDEKSQEQSVRDPTERDQTITLKETSLVQPSVQYQSQYNPSGLRYSDNVRSSYNNDIGQAEPESTTSNPYQNEEQKIFEIPNLTYGMDRNLVSQQAPSFSQLSPGSKTAHQMKVTDTAYHHDANNSEINIHYTEGDINKSQIQSQQTAVLGKRTNRQEGMSESDCTEFTEQMENESQRIDLEIEDTGENLTDRDRDQATEYEKLSNQKLRILNQGQIKIKYQKESVSASQVSQASSLNDRK